MPINLIQSIRRSSLSAMIVAFAFTAVDASATPKLSEGMYRVDWNRKVRDLCIDKYTNDDLTARDWQGVMAAIGPLCTLSNVKEGRSAASWVGHCNQPWLGRVINTEHRVRVKTNTDGSFDIVTVISGDQQATIPIRGVPLKGDAAKCQADSAFFRPWQ